MITITPQQAIFYIILSPLALIVVLMALSVIVRFVRKYSILMTNRKIFKKMMEDVETMKKNGGFHEWITMEVIPGEKTYVCKKTGYCPAHNGFFPLDYIESHIKQLELKEAWDRFKSSKMSEIAVKFGLKFEEMDELTNLLTDIPKQFQDINSTKN